MAKGRFAGIREAKVSKSGDWYKPGHYRVKIKAVKYVESQQENEELFIVETECLKSDNDEIKVGGEYAQIIKMSWKTALSSIKKFISACSAVDPLSDTATEEVEAFWSDITGKELDYEKVVDLFVDSGVAEGFELDLECVNTKTKEGKAAAKAGTEDPDKGNFTVHNWSHENVTQV